MTKPDVGTVSGRADESVVLCGVDDLILMGDVDFDGFRFGGRMNLDDQGGKRGRRCGCGWE